MGIRPFNDLAIEFQHEPQHTPCAAGCCGPKLMVKFRSGHTLKYIRYFGRS